MCGIIYLGGDERMSKLYKIIEVAEHYKVSRQAVYKWIQLGKIKTIKTPGGETRIPETELKK